MSQLASHNKFKHNLFRDTSIVVIITFAVLILSGICGITLVNVISHSGYKYVASSFGKFLKKIALKLFRQSSVSVGQFFCVGLSSICFLSRLDYVKVC